MCKSRKHRVPNNMDAKRTTPRHIVIKTQKIKDKEILKAAKEKKLVTYTEVPTILSADFFAGQKCLARNIQSYEKWGPTAKIALPSKDII